MFKSNKKLLTAMLLLYKIIDDIVGKISSLPCEIPFPVIIDTDVTYWKRGGTVMQKLYFEPAWDKTIAPRDREKIINHFHERIKHFKDGIHFSFLWEAENHKGQKLVTVLIHNGEEIEFRLQDTVIAYYRWDLHVATGIFDLPCVIPGTTTMPWTFIFSQSNETNRAAQHTILNEEE